jgi:hypothetical protein
MGWAYHDGLGMSFAGPGQVWTNHGLALFWVWLGWAWSGLAVVWSCPWPGKRLAIV